MIPGVQTGNGIPHDEYDVHGIAHAHACTNRKDDIFMQSRRRSAHGAGHIPLCGIFLFYYVVKQIYNIFQITTIFTVKDL